MFSPSKRSNAQVQVPAVKKVTGAEAPALVLTVILIAYLDLVPNAVYLDPAE